MKNAIQSAVATEPTSVRARFDLTGRVAVITGGGGLLGIRHGQAIAEMGGIPILLDVDRTRVHEGAEIIRKSTGVSAAGFQVDITNLEAVEQTAASIIRDFGIPKILINNAAHNPKFETMGQAGYRRSRFEHFPLDLWNADLAVGLTGAFLCSQVMGREMAKSGHGVILNIASDLGVIAPDQRIYRRADLPEAEQPVKPVSYSVVKHALIGLTRYLATYWAGQGIRVNALSPGGVYTGQDEGFVTRLTQLIPLGRMAQHDEYKAAIVFLVSDASSYMTGANIIMDGGRTVW